jgi:hypothetical protein
MVVGVQVVDLQEIVIDILYAGLGGHAGEPDCHQRQHDAVSRGAAVGMGDDDQVFLHATYASHLDMDEAFCARMRLAIEAGLEVRRLVSSPRLGPEIQNTFQQSNLPAWHGPLGPRALTSLRNHSVFDADQCANRDCVVGFPMAHVT